MQTPHMYMLHAHVTCNTEVRAAGAQLSHPAAGLAPVETAALTESFAPEPLAPSSLVPCIVSLPECLVVSLETWLMAARLR